MQCWIVSPSVGRVTSSGSWEKSGKALSRWKEIIYEYEAAFMGWGTKPEKDGGKRLGGKFVKQVALGDIILIAYREKWRWHPVACGRVDSEADDKLRFGGGYKYGSYRYLDPFVHFESDPAFAQVSLEATTPDSLRVIPALVKLKPDSNSADDRLRTRLVRLLKAKRPNGTDSTNNVPLSENTYLRASRAQQKIIKPRHRALSNAFANYLRKHGYTRVRQEEGQVDVEFLDGNTPCLAELETCFCINTKLAIREALGQLLEYNFYPDRETAKKWFIVLGKPPTPDDTEFLERLRARMKFPLSICWRSGNSFKTNLLPV